ncbi:MAG: NADPH:quinone oxidoreductase family protein [Paracoccaceae bacterium]|jgi:NADPH2:quinone reductase
MKSFDVLDHMSPPRFVEKPLHAPLDTQIQVKIRACALNFADLLMIKGTYQETPKPPFTLGLEVAGEITALGAGVADFKIGDRVCVFCGAGGLSEYGNFEADRATLLPKNVEFSTAAAFQIAYGTSHVALHHQARLRHGERVVVLGAAGGVGLTAVELAKDSGAEVVAVARGADKLAIAQQAGADHLIDAQGADLNRTLKDMGGVDIVYDAIGGTFAEGALRALRTDGRFLIIGFASGHVPTLKPNHMLVKNISAHGLYWGGYLKSKPEVVKQSLIDVLGRIASGHLRPHISHKFAFDQCQEALDTLKARQSTGKIVIEIDHE